MRTSSRNREIIKISITSMYLKTTHLKLQPHLQGFKELIDINPPPRVLDNQSLLKPKKVSPTDHFGMKSSSRRRPCLTEDAESCQIDSLPPRQWTQLLTRTHSSGILPSVISNHTHYHLTLPPLISITKTTKNKFISLIWPIKLNLFHEICPIEITRKHILGLITLIIRYLTYNMIGFTYLNNATNLTSRSIDWVRITGAKGLETCTWFFS